MDLLIEGYAAIFGEPDRCGDIVRAGAFASSLTRSISRPMLLQHGQGKLAGRWVRIAEDQCGLYVRGMIEVSQPLGKAASALVTSGTLDGLSIGFRARQWTALPSGGRELKEIELVEVSLVTEPMAPRARFVVVASPVRQAA